MRSPKTKEKVVVRLKYFFDFIGITEGSMEEHSRILFAKSSQDKNWLYANLVKYFQHHKQRVENKEISAGTVKNYFQPVKLFCEMNQIELPWKRVSRALPRVKRYADDRAPTIEEIQSICEYPDRRIKAIIYVMMSSNENRGVG